jgi:hypothetical protein
MEIVTKPDSVELHLNTNPDFTRNGWGIIVRAQGGKFTPCRGHCSNRFVTLPIDRVGIINTLISKFGFKNTTLVFRGTRHLPAWVDVQKVSKLSNNPLLDGIEKFDQALENAKSRGII